MKRRYCVRCLAVHTTTKECPQLQRRQFLARCGHCGAMNPVEDQCPCRKEAHVAMDGND